MKTANTIDLLTPLEDEKDLIWNLDLRMEKWNLMHIKTIAEA